jgi:hypothetical protein
VSVCGSIGGVLGEWVSTPAVPLVVSSKMWLAAAATQVTAEPQQVLLWNPPASKLWTTLCAHASAVHRSQSRAMCMEAAADTLQGRQLLTPCKEKGARTWWQAPHLGPPLPAAGSR